MTTSTYDRSVAAGGSTLRVPSFLDRVGGSIRRYVTKASAERQLEGLDDRLLLDIGLKRSDIHQMVWGRR